MWRGAAGLLGCVLAASAGGGGAAEPPPVPRVEVLDRSFDTAAVLFAYTEFELSGEPLAESLGLDLDALDPDQVDWPTAFDYATGIEAYEYSEEAMYALDYQSRMGVHLVNGPVNAARGGTLETLGQRFIELTGAAAYPADELPLNLYPVSLPYDGGSPEFAAAVDTRTVASDEREVRAADGSERSLSVALPGYFRDFATLAWKGAEVPALTPGALGAALLKEVMWSQDFLGGLHTVPADEEVEAASATQDREDGFALGVSSVDGMNGLILTEIAWDKLRALQERLAYDGEQLGAGFGPDYDASEPVWFPSRTRVRPALRSGVNGIEALEVDDAASTLRDGWLLLWGASELLAFSDARSAHSGQNPAFLALFDGAPFPAAPGPNRDAEVDNDVRADDPFSLARNVSNLVFQNLAALHFDAELGSFVDRWEPGGRGDRVSTLDAAYAIVALSVFQRAMDALPVGYAAGDAADSELETPQGARARELIAAQARFIRSALIGERGLVSDRYDVAAGARAGGESLASQFAAIRGLATAFVATGDASLREAARELYRAVERELYDPAVGTYADVPGQPTEHTPWTAGAISAGLRSLLLNLRNAEGESAPELSPAHLTERYTSWFKRVINGGGVVGSGMQLAEWLGDSGENRLAEDESPPAGTGLREDSDGDGVPQVTAAGGPHGTAMTLARRVRVSAGAAMATQSGE